MIGGHSAQTVGTPNSVVPAPKSAAQTSLDDERTMDKVFTELRQLSILQFLIERFLGNFGWSSQEYRGFDHIKSEFARGTVEQRLNELARMVPEESPLGIRMRASFITDQFARAGQADVDPVSIKNGGPGFAGRVRYLLALDAMKRGASEKAVDLLASVIADNPLCGSAYLFTGKLFFKAGQGQLVLSNMSMAFLHPEDFWLNVGHSAFDPVELGEWKGYRLVFYQSEFFAVPGTGDYFFHLSGEHNVLCRNTVASRVRRTLLRMLPEGMVSLLRWVVYSTPLHHIIVKPASFAGFLHEKHLIALLSDIDHCPMVERAVSRMTR
ncbi:MAG: hypothetical protein A3H49_01875 [Nitrospirae bacterium RIFCSPLOWO2_02_FULL_62_14]|nr:MAG: hypothetical protein A3H49_01875 [Nitrospirae bacterium RIFCSPLOWO2_02_FULL_62_14]